MEENRNRKKAKIVNVPREIVPTTKLVVESNSEERGGYEAYSEQPMLSLTVEEAAPTQLRVEERGKQKVKAEKSNNLSY